MSDFSRFPDRISGTGPDAFQPLSGPSRRTNRWFCVLCAAVFALAAPLQAQLAHDEQDPFLRHYVLGNDAELLLGRGSGFEIYNSTGAAPTLMGGGVPTSSTLRDVTSGDFDSEPDDEVAAASTRLRWEGMLPLHALSSVIITICKRHEDGTVERIPTLVRSTDHTMFLPLAVAPQVRLMPGNFDRTGRQQLLAAYSILDTIWLSLYSVDSGYHCVEVARAATPVAAATGLLLTTRELFSAAAGDFDGDGLDEAMVVATSGAPRAVSGGSQYDFRVAAFDFNYHTGQFVPRVNAVFTSGSAALIDSIAIDRISLCTGEFDLDGREEAVLGYEVRSQSTSWIAGRTQWHRSYLEPLDFDPAFSALGYVRARQIKMEEWSQLSEMLGFPISPNRSLTISLAAADLNLDGRDEVIARGGRLLAVYTSDNVFSLARRAAITRHSSFAFSMSRLVAVADLNADTLSTDWTPEIAVVAFQNDPMEQTYQDPGAAYLALYRATLDAGGSITGLASAGQLQIGTYTAGTSLGDWSLGTGDVDGNAIRLGIPLRATKERMLQPIVVLNAPPTHFDMFGGTAYDISKCYNGNIPTLYARYETSTDSTMIVETAMNSDWGVSAELSYGGSFLGIGVKTSLGFKYGEGFSRDSTRSHKLSFAISTDAIFDDEVYVTETNYNLFEYPVYYRKALMGHVLVASPHLQEKNWYSAKDLVSTAGYTLTHEVGNILSYPTYYPFSMNPSFADTIMMTSAGLSLDQNPNKNWSVSITDFGAAGAKKTHTIGTSVGVKVSGWGFEAKVKGTYDKTEISTLRTEVMDQFGMKVHYDAVDRSIGEVNHNVTPYIYWATNGALILDYNVAVNQVANPWWATHYGAQPDLAFILPWRYDPEKGFPLTDESKRQRTSDIVFRPSAASPGDTILIIARIHNFSLLASTAPAGVRFFLGHPDQGGLPITGIDGDTTVTCPSPIDAQSSAVVFLEWIVPLDVPTDPRIYAVIDGANAILEVHEDNNIGYSVLKVTGVVAVDDPPPGGPPLAFALEQNYPNPFNPATTVSYTVGTRSPVTLKVYDLLGREVATLVNEVQSAGRYTVPFDARGLSSGVYFYTLGAGRMHMSKKFILLR